MEDTKKEFCQVCNQEKQGRFCDVCMQETMSRFEVIFFETVTAKESLGIRQKRPGVKKWLVDMFHGFKASESVLEGVELYRKFDKENDQYDEVVKNDQTKEIIHECHEPLSKHIGHGSDKKLKGK